MPRVFYVIRRSSKERSSANRSSSVNCSHRRALRVFCAIMRVCGLCCLWIQSSGEETTTSLWKDDTFRIVFFKQQLLTWQVRNFRKEAWGTWIPSGTLYDAAIRVPMAVVGHSFLVGSAQMHVGTDLCRNPVWGLEIPMPCEGWRMSAHVL